MRVSSGSTSIVTPSGSIRTVTETSFCFAEHVTIDDLVEAAHPHLLAHIPPESRALRNHQTALDRGEIGEVLVDHQAPIVFSAIGYPFNRRQLWRRGAFRKFLEGPQFKDGCGGIVAVRPTAIGEPSSRDHRPQRVGEEEGVVPAHDLLVVEMRPVQAAVDCPLTPSGEVELTCAHPRRQWRVDDLVQGGQIVRTKVTRQILHQVANLHGQEVVLVDVLGIDPQSGAWLGLPPSAVERVGVEHFVIKRSVVLPTEQLGMGGGNVVALVERVDDHLPVGRDNCRLATGESHRLGMIRIEECGHRAEELEQRLRVLAEVDEDEPAPDVDRRLSKANILWLECWKLVPIEDEGTSACEAPAPAVEPATDLAMKSTAAVRKARASVGACVEKCPQPS